MTKKDGKLFYAFPVPLVLIDKFKYKLYKVKTLGC